jgi:hypothetical protein
MLATLQTDCPEGCPYVFVPAWRWEFIENARSSGTWYDGQDLLNNLIRRLATVRKKAGLAKFTFHDLRRTCLTNWARKLPMHVTQKLAGHSDIKTTQEYYLAVREDDLEEARQVQVRILEDDPTDPKLTHSPQNSLTEGQTEKEIRHVSA